MFLAYKYGEVPVVSESLGELCNILFHFVILDTGTVWFNGKVDTISYDSEEFTIAEMYSDFYARRFPRLAEQRGYTIYKTVQVL